MDDLTNDDLFLDAVDADVLVAFERIGDGPNARFRFFRRLLAAAEEEAVRGHLRRRLHPLTGPAGWQRRTYLQTAELAAVSAGCDLRG
jgi:hypothetical protein